MPWSPEWFLRFNLKQFLEIPPVGKNQSFLGFDNRFLGKCHQKTVKSRILNYV